MNRIVVALALLLCIGLSSVCVAKKKDKDENDPRSVYPPMFVDRSSEEAASRLMEVATRLASDDAARNVELARIYYLGGQAELGQQMLDGLLLDSADAKTWLNAGKLFFFNGETERALAAFDRAAEVKHENETIWAKLGAYFNLLGERERAEEAFTLAFTLDSSDLGMTVDAAGSYVGVPPEGSTGRAAAADIDHSRETHGSIAFMLEQAELLTGYQADAGDAWVERAVNLYETVLEFDDQNAQARRRLTGLQLYAGEYANAADHCRTMLGRNDLDEAVLNEARGRLVVARFIADLRRANVEPGEDTPERDLTEAGIRARARWMLLAKVVDAVGQEAGLDDALVMARRLLDGWLADPSEASLASRNDLLAGIVAVLSSLVAEHRIETQVATRLLELGVAAPALWPEPALNAGSLERFRQLRP